MRIRTNPTSQAFEGNNEGDGLTKREYFAAMAMQAILSRPGDWNSIKDHSFVGDQACSYSDILIKALNAEQ